MTRLKVRLARNYMQFYFLNQPCAGILRKALGIFLLSATSLTAVSAQQVRIGTLALQNQYVKPTISGQTTTAGYLTISNSGPDDKLLSASTSLANTVQLHFMSMHGDVMKMSEVQSIDVPSGKTVELKPGAHHLMIMGLKKPIKEGDSLKIKLKFEKSGEVELAFPAHASSAPTPTGIGHHDHMAM